MLDCGQGSHRWIAGRDHTEPANKRTCLERRVVEGAPAASLIALMATPELSVCVLSAGRAIAAAARHTRAKRASMLVDDAIQRRKFRRSIRILFGSPVKSSAVALMWPDVGSPCPKPLRGFYVAQERSANIRIDFFY